MQYAIIHMQIGYIEMYYIISVYLIILTALLLYHEALSRYLYNQKLHIPYFRSEFIGTCCKLFYSGEFRKSTKS